MIKYLTETNCIDFDQLLLLKGKEVGLSDDESHIILLIHTLNKAGFRSVTTLNLLKYSSLTAKKMDKVLLSLLDKKYIYNKQGSIYLNKVLNKLLIESHKDDTDPINLLDSFQENFGRPLSPLEIETLKDFVQTGYSEEMISKALKEAVKAQKCSLRYIEGILKNWAENGIKERYISDAPTKRKVSVSNYKWWEDE
ncbi:MAG: DnaD domain protein [Thomasclavelia sp.]|nr:DnaD domain protein [Thomasclavelia sp.]